MLFYLLFVTECVIYVIYVIEHAKSRTGITKDN